MASLSTGEVIDGRYTVTSVLGEGGMATVYRANQVNIDRDVALKVLHPHIAAKPTARPRFLREARAAGRLTHTNTVRIFDIGEDEDGRAYMALELLRGMPLTKLVRRSGGIRMKRAIDICAQICASLAEAHGYGMVHRDLKADNVFLIDEVRRDDLVKVLDFGLVKMMDAPQLIQLTATGTTAGTPSYMSPEVAISGEVTPRADLYSLGIMLFEMLTGTLPFTAPAPVGVIMQHMNKALPRLEERGFTDGPANLQNVLDRLTAKNPDDRPGSALEAIYELEILIEDLPDGLAAGLLAPRSGEATPFDLTVEFGPTGDDEDATLRTPLPAFDATNPPSPETESD